MKLKSFGCSFIFGDDLSDCVNVPPRPKPSKHTWPALLAQQLNYDYECYARAGGGNLQITELILNQLSSGASQDLFVIGWTWIDRFDYWNDFPVFQSDYYSTNWKTIRPSDKDQTTENYYKIFHSEYRDKLTTLINIKLIIDTLKQKKIPFLMTYMDELLFCNKWHITEAVLELQNYVKLHMTKFEGQTFLEWSRNKGYAESINWHPLEHAHEHAAKYLLGKIFQKETK